MLVLELYSTTLLHLEVDLAGAVLLVFEDTTFRPDALHLEVEARCNDCVLEGRVV